MEGLNVMACSQFDVELRVLVDALLKDVCALATRWSGALQRELTTSKTENQELRRRLLSMEQELFHRNMERHWDLSDKGPQFGSVHECAKQAANVETKPTGPNVGQWIPALSGMKKEELEISITGTEHRLDAACSDVLSSPLMEKEVNCQFPELKTECEHDTEPEIPNPHEERRGDGADSRESQDCSIVDEEHKTENESTQHGFLSPTKTEEKDGARDEEQEERLPSYLQVNSMLLLSNSEPTSSGCSAFVMPEGNADISATDPSDQLSDLAGIDSGCSQSAKRRGPRFICSICGKSLSSKYSLSVHFTMHTGDRPYACMQCGKRFVNRTNLQIHQNIHTGEKPYVCTQCPKTFADPSPFGRHKRMHSGELQQSNCNPKCQYICNICGKTLSTKQGLSYHITMHTGERPYTCTWCGKSFVQKHNLKIHQNIHTGAKPYACTLCTKSFADPSSLKKHKRMHM